MTEILTFPTKTNLPTPTEKPDYSPEAALQYVLDGLKNGDTQADQLVIAWVSHTQEHNTFQYMLGGDDSISGAVGLMEITKNTMMNEE